MPSITNAQIGQAIRQVNENYHNRKREGYHLGFFCTAVEDVLAAAHIITTREAQVVLEAAGFYVDVQAFLRAEAERNGREHDEDDDDLTAGDATPPIRSRCGTYDEAKDEVRLKLAAHMAARFP